MRPSRSVLIASALGFALVIAGIVVLNQLVRWANAPLLERVARSGQLVVAMRHDPAVYFDGADGPDGYEYALAKAFADHLGVRLAPVFPETIGELLDVTAAGEVDMATAGLSVTCARRHAVRFALPYGYVSEQLIYRRGNRRPKSLHDIESGALHVTTGSSHEETLKGQRRLGYPNLSWETSDTDTPGLLAALDRGEIAYTVADSNTTALSTRMFRHAVSAFDLGDEQAIAWAFGRRDDDSLLQAANRFLEEMHASGRLERLHARYFGHTGRLNFVESRAFWRGVRDRLPALRQHFEDAATATGYDWRLLAAIGYQESHWRNDAISPTGVRGIMMLTRGTAAQVGVSDRSDPRASILGGARYLQIIERKIPDRIAGPNRLWLTLAGYNVGFGHLEDARILTERDSADPDLWIEVKRRLPLLADPAYYTTVRRGFARGQEPVDYVDNIRNYFDLLVWYSTSADETTLRYLLADDI